MAFLSPIEKIATDLFEARAILDKRQSLGGKGFKLKLHEQNPAAPLSPFYVNLRTPDNPKPGPLTPEIVSAIGQQFYYLACGLKLEYNYVAGVPNAGDPFAEAFLLSEIQHPSNPVEVLKLKKEETSSQRKITGILNFNEKHVAEGSKVILVDDLITKADSKLEAIKVLEEKGFVVHDVIVFLDRQQGGADELRNSGYSLYSIFTISEILDFYLDNRMMNRGTYGEIKAYLKS